MRAWISLGCALAVATVTSAGRAADALGTMSLSIAVASLEDKPVRDDAWIDAQVAQAERLLGEAGVHVKKAKTRKLDVKLAKLETRKDRDALSALLEPHVVNVFLVDSLRDVDDPKLLRMGVHWHDTKDTKKRYVILAASAMPTTLAHEIGHFFGLPHTKVTDNLMSYDRSASGNVFLSDAQKKTVLDFARLAVRSKELTPS